MTRNTAYIYQPHFKTSMFRVAANKQQSGGDNYIVVTCSPQYNGVWKYPGSLHSSCGRWVNTHNTVCYEIPISSCSFVKSLEEIVSPDRFKNVVKQQIEWFTKEVRNRNYTYAEVPGWFLKESRDYINGTK